MQFPRLSSATAGYFATWWLNGNLFLASLILLAGCPDILRGPPLAPGAPGGAQVSVTFGAGAERTVAPQMGQFSKIDLTFMRKDGAGTLSPVEAQGGAAVISLSPGTWEVTASAYNKAKPPLVAARAVNTLTRSGDQITGDTHFRRGSEPQTPVCGKGGVLGVEPLGEGVGRNHVRPWGRLPPP
ncbi:MAG: hypothetical protein LBG14_05025 [Treponema sp.]|nr:hypothetical protein [Treponema sp.]